MLNSPPSRYRIIERGRRLITIDTTTGQELGLGAALPGIDLVGAKQTVAPPRNQSSSSLGHAPTPQAAPPVVSALVAKAASSALDPLQKRPSMPTPYKPNDANPEKQAKLIAVVAVSIFAVIFLIASNLWPIAVILMLIPQSRKAILPVLASGVKRFLGQDANG